MLVVDRAKVLAVKLKDPAQLSAISSIAKTIQVRGVPVTILPHTTDVVRLLQNMQIKAPAPILHYYDWPGNFTPFEHQKQTAAFLTMHTRGLVLNEIGTGKSMSALWAADYLMRERFIKRVLILSPLSTLERVWGDSIFTELTHRKFVVLYGAAARRKQLLRTKADFYITNHDGFGIIRDECKNMFDLVIVDEAAVLRNASTQRFKIFNRWLTEHPTMRTWLLTGTPTPNAPTDAWALAKLVQNPRAAKTYSTFRDSVMFKVGQWKYVPRPEAVTIVHNILQPSIRYTREECLDLPDTVTQTRHVALTAEQKHHYSQMLKHLITELHDGKSISAVNEAVKLQKLIQIGCGVAYGSNGETIELDCTPRVSLTKDIIEEAGEKVIVFVPLTGTLHMLERELAKHWTVAVVNGAVSAAKRNEIFRQFQHEKDPHVLIAHPKTMAHGLTLTTATTIIWYGPVPSNEIYEQACGRIERIGKHSSSTVVKIESTEVERRAYTRLEGKQALQGLLLDMVKEHTVR